MPERRQNEELAPLEEIAEVKLSQIQFRAEDSEDTRKATLLAMADLIGKKYGKALEPQEGALDTASGEQENPVVVSGPAAGAVEVAEPQETAEAAALLRYKGQYDKLSNEVQSRCTWEELSSRLNAKDSHYLNLAIAMQDRGELVHVDKDGNPVFRDGGVEPVMTGMNYNKAREALYGKDYKEGTVHHGYEMPNSEKEIREIEKFTKRPFVASDNRKEWRSSWMESGKNPSFARNADFRPSDGNVNVYGVYNPSYGNSNRGVVRLLRVKMA